MDSGRATGVPRPRCRQPHPSAHRQHRGGNALRLDAYWGLERALRRARLPRGWAALRARRPLLGDKFANLIDRARLWVAAATQGYHQCAIANENTKPRGCHSRFSQECIDLFDEVCACAHMRILHSRLQTVKTDKIVAQLINRLVSSSKLFVDRLAKANYQSARRRGASHQLSLPSVKHGGGLGRGFARLAPRRH